MTKKPLLVLALCAGLTLAAYAGPATSAGAGKATVGEFAVKVAVALGYTTPDTRAAVAALKGRGVRMVADPSATLTEGEAARIMSDLGMAVTKPSNPGAPVSSTKAGFLAGTIEVATIDAVSTEAVDLPDQCLSSQNRGDCVNCCKAIVGQLPDSGNGTRSAGKECGHFCHANVPPPPSPEEPAP
jgi:hypothetical protein